MNQESAARINLDGEITHVQPRRLKALAGGNDVPNVSVETAHAEIQVLESLNRAGELKGKDVTLYVEFSEGMKNQQIQALADGKNAYFGMCKYCASDVKYYAKESGVNSITVVDTNGNKVRWNEGDKKWSDVNE